MTRLYRGDRRRALPREGTCWVEDRAVAERYAGEDGVVTVLDLDLMALTVLEVEGYDHDRDHTPADCPVLRAEWAATGADVVCYEDEDEYGTAAIAEPA